jgi:hypothetical protein
MDKLWTLLESKGKISTLIGMLLALPTNGRAVYEYFTNVEMSEQKLYSLLIMNVIGWVWVILPSYIALKSKAFTFEIKD